MKCAIYTRVSTDDQNLGLDAQEERCRAFAALRGWEIYGVYVDRVSGTTDPEDRPQASGMLEDARAREFGVVLVLRLDRVVRNAETTLRLVRELGEVGVDLVSATEPIDTTSPFGKAALGMIAVFAELERNLIAARTKEALRAARANGTKLGAPKFDNPEAIALAKDLRAAGCTLNTIRQEFVNRGIPTVRGGAWTETAISRLIKE